MKKNESINAKLVKYSDNQLRGEYIYFFANSENQKMSEDFESEKDAQKWLGQFMADDI